MRVRSDATLKYFIEKIEHLGVSDHVKSLLDDAILHMGPNSPYKGGQDLVTLLRHAEIAARQVDDESTCERIQDAIAYTLNAILYPDLEIKYGLLPGSHDRTLRLLRGTSYAMGKYISDKLIEYLRAHPGVTHADIEEYLRNSAGTILADLVEDEENIGHYKILRGRRETQAWVYQTLGDRLNIDSTQAHDPGWPGHEIQGDTNSSITPIELARLVQLRIRTESLRALTVVVNNPHSTESDIQEALQTNLWIFGGSFLPDLGPRRTVAGTEFDIPLIRPDGSLHIVELKRANVRVVTHQRGKFIPNNEVHRAVGQVMNYLVSIDEHRSQILDKWDIDVRRAHATVVVGHPRFDSSIEERDLNAVLRMYNSHLARVEVITYKQLLDGAERFLSLDDEPMDVADLQSAVL